MLNMMNLFSGLGIAGIIGCMIGVIMSIKNRIECKKEQQRIMAMMRDMYIKSQQVDEFLEKFNLK